MISFPISSCSEVSKLGNFCDTQLVKNGASLLKYLGVAWTWFILIATSVNILITLVIDNIYCFFVPEKNIF